MGQAILIPRYRAAAGILVTHLARCEVVGGTLLSRKSKPRTTSRSANAPKNHLAGLVGGVWGKGAALVAAIGAVVAFVNVWEPDRALLSIENLALEPENPQPEERFRLVITLKNTGKHPATMRGVATDRVGKLPVKPKYGWAAITPTSVPGGDELRVLSDLGTTPLVFTPEIRAALTGGNPTFGVAGFVHYYDTFNYFFGGSVLGFCYVWDPKDTRSGRFSACPEQAYTYSRRYWLFDGIDRDPMPAIDTGLVQTSSPTTLAPRVPDYRRIQTLQTRPK
jgi:hypothetical protein